MEFIEIVGDELVRTPDTPELSISSQELEDVVQMALEESPTDIEPLIMSQPVLEAPKPRLQDNAFNKCKPEDNPARPDPRTEPTVKLFKYFITKEQQTALLEAASRLRNAGLAWEIHDKRANTRPECIKEEKSTNPTFAATIDDVSERALQGITDNFHRDT